MKQTTTYQFAVCSLQFAVFGFSSLLSSFWISIFGFRIFLLWISFSLPTTFTFAQHTFSIVAVDTITGEVGSAGATCLNVSQTGNGGADIISGILPGVGAVNAQASVCSPINYNLMNALDWMEQGLSAQAILDSLVAMDGCAIGDANNRQYGIATFNGDGSAMATGYTGSEALDYANHIIGPNYAIQGNILIGPEVLTQMEDNFLNTEGTFAEKIMAALQGANIPGADSRCLDDGTSSRSAFIRLACPEISVGFICDLPPVNIVVSETPFGVEPIDSVQQLFDLLERNANRAANDECFTALSLIVGENQGSCNTIQGNLSNSTTSLSPLVTCDEIKARNDVWFSFTTGETVDQNIILQADFNVGGDNGLTAISMAVYADCATTTLFSRCTIDLTELDNTYLIPMTCLMPEHTYYVRISDGLPNVNSTGSFNLCVYNQEAEMSNSGKVVVWGNEVGQGDFNGGLNEWTTTGISGENHVWQWQEDGMTTGLASQSSLESQTRCNGVMSFNADILTTRGDLDFNDPQPYPIYVSELISPPIDLTDVDVPSVSFAQEFVGLNGNGQAGFQTQRGALFSYSIDDGATWSEPIRVNDDLPFNEYTPNPDIKEYPLSGAAGATAVRLKFTFSGDFYFWAIDDVKVLNELPVYNTAIVDRQIMVAENYATPISQIGRMTFGGELINLGNTPADATFSFSIDYTDEMGVLMPAVVEEETMLTLDVGENDLVDFGTSITLSNRIGNYSLNYMVAQDFPDQDESDNNVSTPFALTAHTYSKAPLDEENKPIITTLSAPVNSPFEAGIHLYVPNGQDWQADSVTFGIGSIDAISLAGETMTVYLYQWEDANSDRTMSGSELTVVGSQTYVYPDTPPNDLITVALNPNDGADFVRLTDDTHYLLMVGYEGEHPLSIAFNNSIDYQYFTNNRFIRAITTQNPRAVRYADVLKRGNSWFNQGFEEVGVPAMSLQISPVIETSMETAALAPSSIQLQQTLVTDQLIVHVQTLSQQPLQLSIFNNIGQLVQSKSYDISKGKLAFDVTPLADGLYFLIVQVGKDKQVLRFVKTN